MNKFVEFREYILFFIWIKIYILVYNTYYTVTEKLVFNMQFSNFCDFYVQIYSINITYIN